MATLHIISACKSPLAFAQLLAYFCHDDAVIFIQDGCYSLMTPEFKQLLKLDCYAIANDLAARNLLSRIPEQVKRINYSEFVDLTLSHQKTISW